jgi:hypothetical protein
MATPINMMTGENCGTQRKTCSSAILSTTNVTWTALRLNPVRLGEELMIEYFEP